MENLATAPKAHTCNYSRLVYTGECKVMITEKKNTPEPVELNGHFRVMACSEPGCEWTDCKILDIESTKFSKESA